MYDQLPFSILYYTNALFKLQLKFSVYTLFVDILVFVIDNWFDTIEMVWK